MCSTRRFPTCAAWLALAVTASAQSTIVVSVDSAGLQGNGHSYASALAAGGRYVAFESQAANLVAGDTNGVPDVFVRDLLLGATERVNVDSSGAQGDGTALDFVISGPALTPDGRYVAFEGFATNLVAGDTNALNDIFVRDRVLGTTERVSVDSAGAQSDGDSFGPALSADGRFVAFVSYAANLVAGDTNATPDVFVRDRLLGTTVRASVDSAGAQGSGASVHAALSSDGRYVAFQSNSSNLVPGDGNGTSDAFVHDLQSATTECVSVDPLGATGNGTTLRPVLSADGRFVAFASQAGTLVAGDTNLVIDVFVRDRLLATTVRVSVGPGGAQGNNHCGASYAPALTADGRFVAFDGTASNLVAGDSNGSADVFVHELSSGVTERASVDGAGTQGNNVSARASISADGRYVAFDTYATNLGAGDVNGFRDVLLRDREPALATFCYGDGFDASHTSACPCGNTGALGRGCAHSFDPGGARLTADGSPGADDVVLASSSTPVSSFTLFLQHDALGDAVFHDGVLCAGGTLVRLRGRAAVAGQAWFPNSNFDSSITLSQRGGVFPGQGVRRYYAAWYRNASPSFCPPATANVTNGLLVDW